MSNLEQSDLVKSDAPGHPPGLPMLFFAEMWERFCFYGMRSLLMLYMVSEVFKYNDETSANIYGSYNAMIYLTPLIGGIVADKLLGYRWTILIGGLFMAVGQFTLVVQQEFFFYTGMAFMVVGNGMFKPNISTLVGKIYGEGNDAKKDAGFTIFYIGINLGAFLATLICGYFAKTGDWTYGFGIAGVGMLVGIFTFAKGKARLEGHGEPPNLETFSAQRAKVIIGGLLVVPVVYFLLRADEVVLWILIVAATLTLGYLLVVAFQSGKVAREKIFVLLILWVFHFLFWAFFEQAGTSMTLFTDRNIDLDLAGWEFPAAWGQFFNPLFILIFGSVFTLLWVKLSSIGKNPSIPIKFALGLIQLGAGFGILVMGASWADDTGLVSLFILIFCYLLHTTGELCISPVGLSAVTKLAPARMTGMVMGVWFMSIAFAHKIGGKIAASMAVDTTTMTPADTLPVYADTFMIITYSAVGAGFLLMILTPLFLKKWLHGVE